MRPDDYQPPLTWWSHTWRLVLMLVISGVAWGTRAGYQWEYARWWFVTDLSVGLLTYVVVWWRRSHPVAVATIGNLASIISASSAGAGILAMVSLSTRRNWREIIPQAVLAAVCGVLGEEFFNVPDVNEPALLRYGILFAVLATMIGWGMYIGSRRELFASWRQRAILAEAEQEAEVRRARSVERARIAREMHDVLAHRISTVSMYAGALAYRDDLDRAQVKETAQTIQETSHLALTELREVLGVLREGPGDADPEQPQAVPQDLDALIEEGRAGGTRIEYSCSADLATMAPARFRTLYRCLQEALTNARKHAPAAAVTVRIKGDPDVGVDLLVDNPLPLRTDPTDLPPRSGLGLVGVAERVALSGGRQSALRTDDRHFVLHVWLPWST
ncbi:sensor histidine kinase [Gordonia insulae]|uniref:histidine kinase n=1 Tax=Gordonia insulae TaxID=2420509 RepID=A0A3G8JWT9_9ACTN|nr:histidine kinase [Gordonia insulae]AZG48690.1 Signal transduction histidine-protein kinase/phosphatase UhpB [Gordonia insulae]